MYQCSHANREFNCNTVCILLLQDIRRYACGLVWDIGCSCFLQEVGCSGLVQEAEIVYSGLVQEVGCSGLVQEVDIVYSGLV